MSKHAITWSTILKDLSKHIVTVGLDNGHLYRHLFCRVPGTSSHSFHVATTPDQLHYYGDMGSFTFSRIPDMFQFFRRPVGSAIDLQYWAQKLQSVDKACGYIEYSADTAIRYVDSIFDDVITDYDQDNEAGSACSDRDTFVGRVTNFRDETRDALRGMSSEDEAAAYLLDLDTTGIGRADGLFSEVERACLVDYTYHYVWCCHAIVWAVAEYDKLRDTQVPK